MYREDAFRALGPHGFHRIAYTDWPGADPVPVVCVHGLTRNGRDFDHLAAALSTAGRRVVCPDVAGRGKSEWLPPADYNFLVYQSDMAALLARIGSEQVDWVGTSMGGLIGLFLAAQPNSPIRRLVLNDVGAFVPATGLARIQTGLTAALEWSDLDGAERWLRLTLAGFGQLTDEQWRHLATHSVRRDGGMLKPHYDPALLGTLGTPQDVPLWPFWEQVKCPVLVLRGADSDILQAATVDEMRHRGPGCEVVEFPGVGHAPALMDPEQIAVVREWLG